LDPFAGGVTLTHEQLAEKLRTMYGESNPFVARIPQLLLPASKKEILIRMLRNLKGIYLQQNDFERTLSVIDRLILLDPTQAAEIRARGVIQQRLGRLQAALQDFRTYLQMAPQAEDAEAIRTMLARMTARLN
jgi:regulator of sirC expression with transglutaminase-like and TPR domain